MFASQLLRIWEAIPNESSLCGQDMTVEENPKITLNISEVQNQLNGPRMDHPPIAFEVEGISKCPSPILVDDFSLEVQHQLNGPKKYSPVAFEVRDIDKCLRPKVVREFSSDDEFGKDDPQDRNGILHTDPLSPGANATDTEVQVKNVLKFESHESVVVSSKESNHVVKDISIDEGRHACVQDAFEKIKDVQPPKDTKFVAAEGCDDFVCKRLPVQEYGTRSFLQAFIDTLDIEEGNEVAQRAAKQCSSEKSKLRKIEGIKTNILRYDSTVEGGTITFNFISNGRNENIEDKTVGNLSDTKQPQCSCDDNSDRRQSPCTCNENPSTDKVHESPPNVIFSIMNKCGMATCDDNLCKEDICGSSMSNSVIVQDEYDLGEASFSAASLVPVPCSGSVSLRSDASTTSGRSFAFPILQPEWNTSPVRMAPGKERHFQRHKCWRSGLLCCKF